ncbi:MAG: ABC transporter permease [Tissierellia bacterium]|nr:ABC transporter permease [Tissierellia bacterium]
MFFHSFKNSFKTLLRNRGLVFWSLVFPLLLALFFKMSLSNIDKNDKFETLKISVDEKALKDPFFQSFMDQMEKEGYFKVSKTQSQELLLAGEVIAHIEEKDRLVTKKSGIKETLVENIMDSYLQNEATILNILKANPQADISKVIKTDEYIEDKSSQNMDLFNTYFYVLVGMQAMYGYLWGLELMYQYEANLSTKGKRNAMAPIKKSTSLLASISLAWLVNMAIVLITMAFCAYVLGVNFGPRLDYMLLLVSIAGLTGVSFGSLLAVSNKKDYQFKAGLGISLVMLMSFLSGMMVAEMKIIVQKNLPLINKINPIALISDAIYSLYYYEDLTKYYTNLAYLGAITLLFLTLTLYMIRGKKYDSL